MKLLKQDIEQITNMIKFCKNEELKKYYISTLYDLIAIASEFEEINIDSSYEKINDKQWERYLFKNLIQTNNPTYTTTVEKICINGLNSLEQYEEEYECNKNIDLKLAKELILEFFNEYDKTLLPLIKLVLDEDHLLIKNGENNGGLAIYNSTSNTPYIFLNTPGNFNFQSLNCLIHEIGHIINFVYTKCNHKLTHKLACHNFVEVPGNYFQILFLHFLIDKRIENIEVEKIINNILYNLRENLFFLLISKNLKISNKLTEEIVNKFLLENDITLDEGSSLGFLLENYQYSYGPLISLSYLASYKKDPEKTKYNFDDFNKSFAGFTDMYIFNHFGLNSQDIITLKNVKEEVIRNQKQLIKISH